MARTLRNQKFVKIPYSKSFGPMLLSKSKIIGYFSTNNNSGANTTNDINTNTASLDIKSGPAGGIPDNEGTITADINYYLGRMDKVLLTRDREWFSGHTYI